MEKRQRRARVRVAHGGHLLIAYTEAALMIGCASMVFLMLFVLATGHLP